MASDGDDHEDDQALEAAADDEEEQQQQQREQQHEDDEANDDHRRQWPGQHRGPLYVPRNGLVCFAAHNMSPSPPSAADLLNCLPGHDGSYLSHKPSAARFTTKDLDDNPLLPIVGDHCAEQLALKLQHCAPIESFENHGACWINSPMVSDEYRQLLEKHAADYDKSINFVSRFGAKVKLCGLLSWIESLHSIRHAG